MSVITRSHITQLGRLRLLLTYNTIDAEDISYLIFVLLIYYGKSIGVFAASLVS